jgi:DNA topoisomerase-1
MSKPARKATRRKHEISTPPITDPVESARASGLRYVTDSQPGICRKKSGAGFRYTGVDGKSLHDSKALARIKSLVIPPAWTDVWISPYENSHLQVTGRDARGRKQSRYHPHWREVRDETKYERMLLFAEALPAIRARVLQDIAMPGLSRAKILATIVSLMQATLIRVGNEKYAHDNHSYGLTTMRNRHVEINGANITFTFQGKSRVHHTINLHDRRLARIVKQCTDISGYQLFQYLDPEGNRHAIDSADVNEYLHTISGEHFTAKDFRTWAGSVLACDILCKLDPCETATQAKKNIVQAIATVAARLGNTPTVCRKCYIHPAVLAAYLDGTQTDRNVRQATPSDLTHATALQQEEQALLHLLKQSH